MNKSKKKFKILSCAPNKTKKIGNKKITLTCYSNTILQQMKNIWNRTNVNKIKYTDPFDIWYFFKSVLNNSCNNELCWLNYKPFQTYLKKNNIKNELFRPFAPNNWRSNIYAWLSNIDIKEVLNQYEKEYPDFVFIGPSSIDFDDKKYFGVCVWEKLCKFNLQEYYNKRKTKIGIIFNLSKHDEEGSHWVSLFIDIKKSFIFYFDSNGDSVPIRIKRLVDRIKEQGNLLKINFKFMNNYKVRHQNKDGSCGMYALYFIIKLIREDYEPEHFIKNKIRDEEVQKYRKIYFNI